MKPLLIAALRSYQALGRPLLPPCCRFSPSCSDYALQAVERFGCVGGLWLAALRLCRCHPLNPGGWDPLPPLEQNG